MKSKKAEEIVYNILDIFTILIVPSILKSDNGAEFCRYIIQNVYAMWNEFKLVHWKSRLSQSQGSVERDNYVIENMLAPWSETNQTPHWSEIFSILEGKNCSQYE